MKNIQNLITKQTRLEAITELGVEYGTEEWHKRCTGASTASAMQLLAHAMQRQGKAVDASAYTPVADTREAAHVLRIAEQLVDKLGLVGFVFSHPDGTVRCNVFKTV